LYVNVSSIKEWTANPLVVAQDIRKRAGTLFHRIAVIAAGTGVHRGDKHKVATTSPSS